MKLGYFTASYLVKAEKSGSVREPEVCYIAHVVNKMSETRRLPGLFQVHYTLGMSSLTDVAGSHSCSKDLLGGLV